MSKYIPRTPRQISENMPNQISVYFHNNNLLRIKDSLGSKCTAIYHVSKPVYELQEVLNEEGEPKAGMLKRVKTNTVHSLVAKFGKKKPIKAMLNGTPDDIKGEYYAQLKNDLTNAARKRGLL